MPKLTRNHAVLIAVTAAAWLFQLAYMVMPIDLIPDLIPILGWIDDLVGLTGTLSLTGFTLKQLWDAGWFKALTDRPATPELYEPIDEFTLRAL